MQPKNIFPIQFNERLKDIFPSQDDVEDLFKPAPGKSFRINTLKGSLEDIKLNLKALDLEVAWVPWYPSAFWLAKDRAALLLESPLSQDGRVYAQGMESMLAVLALDPKPGEQVLDLCAAPGSKTTQIAALMNNEGDLVANEPITDRFFRLKSVIERLGAKVRLSRKDGRLYKGEAIFDKILVDAPCSSEGRFRVDDPKSYAFWKLSKIKEMAHKQKGLLLNASRLLRKGGVLVYATCTFAPEENEEVISWFLKKTQGTFRVEQWAAPVETYPALRSWGKKNFDPQVCYCTRILPQPIIEGFFIAKLRRIELDQDVKLYKNGD